MATICPKDGKPCPDDVCLGSGVCGLTGHELWNLCSVCRQVYSEEYGVECACEPEPEYDDDYSDEELA